MHIDDLPVVDDPDRGCGNLREGGCYLRGGDFSEDGTLEPWTWALGEHIIGGKNLNISAPPRSMTLVRLPETLHKRSLWTGLLAGEKLPAPLAHLPAFSLIDHVGSSYYTPWSFYQETEEHGPSRRVPEDFAATIARYTPLPILFTHSWLPVVDKAIRKQLCAWGEVPAIAHFTPTYLHPDWGIRADSAYQGDEHWIINVLRRMAMDGDNRAVHLSKIMPPELVNDTLISEQAFGISWIVRVLYVAKPTDTPERLEELLGKGIEPVRKPAREEEN